MSVEVWARSSDTRVPVPSVVVTPWFHLNDDYAIVGIDPVEIMCGTMSLEVDAIDKLREWIDRHRPALLAYWRNEIYEGEFLDAVGWTYRGTDEDDADEIPTEHDWSVLRPHNTGLPMSVWIDQRIAADEPPVIMVACTHSPDAELMDAATAVISPTVEVIEGSLEPRDREFVAAWIRLNHKVLVDFWSHRFSPFDLPYFLQQLEGTDYPVIDYPVTTPVEACVAGMGWPMVPAVREACDALAGYSYFLVVDNDRLWELQDAIEGFCMRRGRLEQDWSMAHVWIHHDSLYLIHCLFAFADQSQQAAVVDHFRNVAHHLYT